MEHLANYHSDFKRMKVSTDRERFIKSCVTTKRTGTKIEQKIFNLKYEIK